MKRLAFISLMVLSFLFVLTIPTKILAENTVSVNLPKLYHYPDSTQTVDLKVGLKAGKAQDLFLRHSPKPEQKIVCILVRGSKTGADNIEFYTDNSGKTILNISALTKASLPKDRLVIQIDNSIISLPFYK